MALRCRTKNRRWRIRRPESWFTTGSNRMPPAFEAGTGRQLRRGARLRGERHARAAAGYRSDRRASCLGAARATAVGRRRDAPLRARRARRARFLRASRSDFHRYVRRLFRSDRGQRRRRRTARRFRLASRAIHGASDREWPALQPAGYDSAGPPWHAGRDQGRIPVEAFTGRRERPWPRWPRRVSAGHPRADPLAPIETARSLRGGCAA